MRSTDRPWSFHCLLRCEPQMFGQIFGWTPLSPYPRRTRQTGCVPQRTTHWSNCALPHPVDGLRPPPNCDVSAATWMCADITDVPLHPWTARRLRHMHWRFYDGGLKATATAPTLRLRPPHAITSNAFAFTSCRGRVLTDVSAPPLLLVRCPFGPFTPCARPTVPGRSIAF